jgi:hypothetical protein
VPAPENDLPSSRPASHGPVVTDPEAVKLITEHGGRLYVYADTSGQKHVQTEAPSDPSVRFRQVAADGFLFYVQEDIEHPETWSVTFSHIPQHHLDVVWEGHPLHPHLEQTVCLVEGHDWEPDPDSKEIYPVVLCRRCGKRRELSEVLVDRLPGGHGGRGWGGVRPVHDH